MPRTLRCGNHHYNCCNTLLVDTSQCEKLGSTCDPDEVAWNIFGWYVKSGVYWCGHCMANHSLLPKAQKLGSSYSRCCPSCVRLCDPQGTSPPKLDITIGFNNHHDAPPPPKDPPPRHIQQPPAPPKHTPHHVQQLSLVPACQVRRDGCPSRVMARALQQDIAEAMNLLHHVVRQLESIEDESASDSHSDLEMVESADL